MGSSRTFPAAAELDGNSLVHVLVQVEDVLLLGPLLLARASRAALASTVSPSPATAAAAPSAVATTSPATPVRGSVGHVSLWGSLAAALQSRPFSKKDVLPRGREVEGRFDWGECARSLERKNREVCKAAAFLNVVRSQWWG